jgi:rhodanese-related sulfurtransferase
MIDQVRAEPASITPAELHERQQAGQSVELIDVRTQLEYNVVHARGAQSVPLGALAAFVAARRCGGAQEPLYLICHSGGRSRAACLRMTEAGLENVVNVDGGTAEWRRAGLPVDGTGWLGARRWLRVGGPLSAPICLALGLTVAPAFAYAAAGIWLLLVFTGNAPCCSSNRCSTNRGG